MSKQSFQAQGKKVIEESKKQLPPIRRQSSNRPVSHKTASQRPPAEPSRQDTESEDLFRDFGDEDMYMSKGSLAAKPKRKQSAKVGARPSIPKPPQTRLNESSNKDLFDKYAEKLESQKSRSRCTSAKMSRAGSARPRSNYSRASSARSSKRSKP